MSTLRSASHAGSWYSSNANTLNTELTNWLAEAPKSHAPAKAIISPHAGYSYCGATAAYAYRQIDPTNIKKVFILGPSHHVHLGGCALTQCKEYQTPLYNLPVDQDINDQLHKTGKFEYMSLKTDEDEHSIEMQLSYVAKIMESVSGQFKIVPIMVGNVNSEKERMYGELLAPYFLELDVLFVISSDFCHWGERFSYTYYDPKDGEIWRSIEALDRKGMALIEALEPTDFKSYLNEYDNTICGRHPISVLLNIIKHVGPAKFNLKFTQYAQSSKCKKRADSSVSYASASVVVK